MDINLGTKIRELRKKRSLTQEELAVKLNISSQAISKWENGTCYPDMEQIPTLANFFGVSLDELFNYDVTQLNEKIDQIIEEQNKYFWKDRKKSEEILVNALQEYPDNERLMIELAELYTSEAPDKALPMAEDLANNAKDFLIQGRAKAILTALYVDQGRHDDANRVVESLPILYSLDVHDRLRVGGGTLRGKDRLKWAIQWKTEEIQELYLACKFEGQGYFETEQYEQALESFGQYRRVIELFMKSQEIHIDSYLWGGMQTHHWAAYLHEAACLVKLGRIEEAQEKVERAKYILLHAWVEQDGSANYLEENPERYLGPFRRYYSEWGLEELGECPV